MTDKSSRQDGAVQAGMILQIGGASPGQGWGMNAIEVREASDAVGWRWRTITNDERQKLIDALNAASTRDGAEEAEDDFGDMPSAYLVARAAPPAVVAEPVAHRWREKGLNWESSWRYCSSSERPIGLVTTYADAAIEIEPLYASPTVWGDRELGQCLINCAQIIDVVRAEWKGEGTWSEWDQSVRNDITKQLAILSLPVQPVAPRLPQDTLDRLAALSASAEEIKDALAKAYALYRWKAKLEDLPDDMKDDCYGFAGSIKSGAGEREALEPCKGEQLKFEEWAKLERYDMAEHPLHYLFFERENLCGAPRLESSA